jgi:hypothetical protein
MKRFLSIIVLVLFCSCGSSKTKVLATSTNPMTKSSDHTPFFDINEFAEDPEYGLIGEKPVKVGDKSVENQRRYLASLAGPNGEELTFHRLGSCCPYKSDNGFLGSAMVDIYEITYNGLKEPIRVYISFYDSETLYIPKGFTKRL